jgi:DNA invertase Pin-like site-specific DNA recombinase
MVTQSDHKVTASHLARTAYLYIRQSTLHQVMENTESTERQYALQGRAVALGWPAEHITVIDTDLGRSGASSANREGFQRLVADVGMGKAGIVMGLEVSRLARNSMDWHRLLEICALSDTLILDEDGLYDPQDFNDRLLLGLKGTMSEAELHWLRARLRGGILSRAQRGELRAPLPVGFVYDETGQVLLDPDQQVQEAIRFFFETFRRVGSALSTVKTFRRQELLFPARVREGLRKGELVWSPLQHSRALHLLHNPRYAGAFFFGRTKTRRMIDSKPRSQALPQDQWYALLPDAHAGYITWQEYEDNQRRLTANSQLLGGDRRKSPPREGPALLQGLVICGVCGRRMTVGYHRRKDVVMPDYVCQREGISFGRPSCQRIPGASIDEAVGNLIVETMTPLALEVALAVQDELQSRLNEADQLRQEQVQRARYEAELARHRYMQVDPDNRLVANSLEADWNQKLRELNVAQEQYDHGRERDRALLDESQRRQVLALATDLPRIWRDPETPQRERKRLLRLLIQDVTLIKQEHITLHVRFKGGSTTAKSLPLPRNAWQTRTTDPRVVQEIDSLLDHFTDSQLADHLNEGGFRSGEGRSFHAGIVARIRKSYGLKSRYDRLREQGFLTLQEIAHGLGVTIQKVRVLTDRGLLVGRVYNARMERLYEPPGLDLPGIVQQQKLSERQPSTQVATHQTNEVQYAS